MPAPESPLSTALRDRVLERLGFSRPPGVDQAGLRALYQAWCLAVPFDNIRKMTALRAAGRPPLAGATAQDFFDAWLNGGAGGTCWPGSNALHALLRSSGFSADRVAASMRDTGAVTHGSVRVGLDGGYWLVDSSLLTNIPIPLGPDVFIHHGPIYAAEVEPDAGTHLLWVDLPTSDSFICCRLLEFGVSQQYFDRRYEESRSQSPFNGCVYARRNRPEELLILRGPVRTSKTAAGVSRETLSPAGICECLREEIGISGGIIDEWVASGSLASSFEPYSGPPPPPPDGRRPPSQRTHGAPAPTGP